MDARRKLGTRGRGSWRRSALRWTGRLLLAFSACELTLRLAGALLPRLVLDPRAAGDAILCIGDSNTFGIGAAPGRSYPDQLHELLVASGSQRAVVNLGVSGLRAGAALDRLEAAIDRAVPRAVVFLAGLNDRTRSLRAEAAAGPVAAAPRPGRGERLAAALRRSAAVRMAQTGWRVLNGDVARAEFGGRERDPLDPDGLDLKQFESAYPRARTRGIAEIEPWLVKSWQFERPDLMRRAWRDFSAQPGVEQHMAQLRLPRAAYAWEIERLCGAAPPPPLAPIAGDGHGAMFTRFTVACADLERGAFDSARARLAEIESVAINPRWRAYLRLHSGWIGLLEGDTAAAARDLTRVLDDLAALNPRAGLSWAMGGAAVATALSGGGGALESWRASRRSLWNDVEQSERVPLAREWLLAAELIDAAGDARRDAALRRRASQRFGSPRTAPLKWLLAHPDATRSTLLAELPLEAPRASWIGPMRLLLAQAPDEELDRLLAPSFGRLAALARRHGFEAVVVNYLDYQEPALNELLGALARRFDLTHVDLHAIHDRAELARDDKSRYFSPDRGHPNEHGYALIARAVFEKLRELRVVP